MRQQATASFVELVHSGALNRCDVLKRGIAFGLSAPALAALLADCGGDDDDETTATLSGQSAEATATESSVEATDEPTEAEEATTSEPEDDSTATEGQEISERSGTLNILR